MATSYEHYRVLTGMHNDLKYGVYDPFIVEQVFQKSRSINIEDAFSWMLWCNLIEKGKLYFGSVHVGSCPSPDVCVEENNRKLETVSGIFEAVFCGGTQGHDGSIMLYAESITLRNNAVFWEDHSGWQEEIKGKSKTLGRGAFFPLEVGYYDPCRALDTILSERRLARWPYNHKYIYLFHYEDD